MIAKDAFFPSTLIDSLELSDKYLVVKHAVLMSQGTWNGVYYSKNEIKNAMLSTDWNSSAKNLFLDHEDTKAREWLGEVKNPSFSGDTMFGDLYIYDPIWIHKLKHGKPKVGISPKVEGMHDEHSKALKSFEFQNFSMVINPAVKTAFINNMEVLEMSEETSEPFEEDLEEELRKKKKYPYPPEKAQEEEDELKKKKYPYPKPCEEDILEAAKEILRKRKKPYPYPEKASEEEEMDDILVLLESLELKGKGVGAIAKKAKEIRKPGESWKAAIRRAAKAMEEELIAKEVETKAELEKKVEEMSVKIKELAEKLNEPAKKILKESPEQTEIKDVDEGMLAYLKADLESD